MGKGTSEFPDEVGQWVEYDEAPDHPDHVEGKVSTSRAFGIGVRAHGGEPGGHCGADVFTEDDRSGATHDSDRIGSDIAEPTIDRAGHGDRHRGGGGLHE